MSENNIWSYLTYQSKFETINEVTGPNGWYDTYYPIDRPISFHSYLNLAELFSTRCQFIILGKVNDYRNQYSELKHWRSGYLCFYSLNFAFEAKNLEVIVALRQLLPIPSDHKLSPIVSKFVGSKKDASDEMDRYFNQYNNHVMLKGVKFIILCQYDIPYVRQFLRKMNANWIDHHYEIWESIQPY